MSKRMRGGGSVTGGTGDIKPQILTLSVEAGAIQDYRVNQIRLPTIRFGSRQGRATITEILKVWFWPALEDALDSATTNMCSIATTNLNRVSAEAVTLTTLAADLLDTHIIASVAFVNTISTNGGMSMTFPYTVDLTDSNGNGVLVATDTLFIVGANAGGATAGSFVAKVLYRLVDVGVQEYVGILQAQQ